jgi:hypothetical protein
MSDYGFATYDERTGRVSEKINSKYPIFGPEYKNISTQYKTVKIFDTTVNKISNLPSSGVTIPTDSECYWISQDHYFGENGGPQGIYEDKCIYRYKHGFKKRPFGYAIITGKLVRNLRYVLQQNQVSGMNMGGTFRVPLSGDGVITSNIELAPRMGKMSQLTISAGEPWVDPTVMVTKVAQGGVATRDIIIKDSCDNAFVRPLYYHIANSGGQPVDQSPYRVEITDTEVKIYRRTFWYDSIARAFQTAPSYAAYNVNQRTKLVEDYAGSRLEVTIYLVPYNMEDLG